MIKTIIADANELVREGLKRIISLTGDIAVSGEAANGQEVLACIHEACDLLIMDVSMPDMGILDLLGKVRQIRPALPVMMLSFCVEPYCAAKLLKSGVPGYATKDSDARELLAAMRKVADGKRYVETRVAESMALLLTQLDSRQVVDALSPREQTVMQMLVEGMSINHIADVLSLSAKTVSTHKMRLMEKMGINNNADLIRYGMEQGVRRACGNPCQAHLGKSLKN